MTAYSPPFAEHVDAHACVLEAIVRVAAKDYRVGAAEKRTGQHYHSARRFLARAELLQIVEVSIARRAESVCTGGAVPRMAEGEP